MQRILIKVIATIHVLFVVSSNAQDSFKIPDGCDSSDGSCQYQVSWVYNPSGDIVTFTVMARVGQGQWAGLGFSVDQSMVNSDAAVGWVTSGSFTLTDRYLFQRRPDGVPVDAENNLSPISGSYTNGVLTMVFSRPRNTGDPLDLSLSNCVFLLFAWGGDVVNNQISKHADEMPSRTMVCIGPMSTGIPTSISPPMTTDMKNCFPECPAYSSCTFNYGQPKCVCHKGYKPHPSGKCIVHNACIGKSCSAHAVCHSRNGVAYCSCKSGYKMLRPKHCVPISVDPCHQYNCGSHGYCVVYNQKPMCRCKGATKPTHAVCKPDPCHKHECGLYGFCVVAYQKPMCWCKGAKKPTHGVCKPDPCHKHECGPYGFCVVAYQKPMCRCKGTTKPTHGGVCKPDPCHQHNCGSYGYCTVYNHMPVCKCVGKAKLIHGICKVSPCNKHHCGVGGYCVVYNQKPMCKCKGAIKPTHGVCKPTPCKAPNCRCHGRCHWNPQCSC